MAKKIDLSWFNLNDYKSLEDFSLAQWIEVLVFRKKLNDHLKQNEGDYSDERIDIAISAIKNIPLMQYRMLFPCHETENPLFPFNTYSVRSTPVNFISLVAADCRLKEWAIDSNNIDPYDIPVDLIFHKNPSLGDISFTNVLVDLSSSDEQITKDFLYWLVNYRIKTGYSAPKRDFTEKNFKEWISMQLLPYIDLTLIALYEGTSITQYKLGHLLFPDDIEIDGTERIRRTVKPKANWLLEDSTSLAMQSQAYSSMRHNNY